MEQSKSEREEAQLDDRLDLAKVAETLVLVAIFGWLVVMVYLLIGRPGSATASPTSTLISSPTPLMATAAVMLPTDTAAATDTATLPPTATPTPTPTDTATPTQTPTPSETPTITPTPSQTPSPVPMRGVYPDTATPVGEEVASETPVPTPVPLVSMPTGTINILLLGSDQRPYETSWRTDVVIVVSINPNIPTVTMFSIPRDLWLYIPNWTYQRINLADTHGAAVGYPGGGPGLIKQTIEYNLGIHVDYYARVNFAGLMRIVDTLGGIDVILDCPVEDGFPDDPISEDPSVVTQISNPVPGVYHLDGKHALWVARSRKTTSEFARSRRQHRVLQGIWVKARQLGLVTRIPELWEELSSVVQTDLTLDDVLWLVSIGLQLDESKVSSGFIDGAYLTYWTTPGGAFVLLPHTEEILESLEDIFNPYPYKAPQGMARVQVWNGSGNPSWEVLAADKLLRNGFEVVDMGGADQYYEHSMIVDFTTVSKGSPLPMMQRVFEVWDGNVIFQPDANSPYAFRLIIGADYQPCERPRLPYWATPTPAPPTETPTPMPGE